MERISAWLGLPPLHGYLKIWSEMRGCLMPSTRLPYPPEFRAEAVRLATRRQRFDPMNQQQHPASTDRAS